MRNPSVHITESDLVEVLNRIKGIEEVKYNSNKLAAHILRLSKGRSATNRALKISQERIERRVNKILKSSIGDALLFSNLLNMVRQTKFKHRGIVKIDEGHKDWPLLKELSEIALDFCKAFNLSKKEGFTQFISIGISKMNKYNLARLKSMADSIIPTYEAYLKIQSDPNGAITDKAYKTYVQIIISKTGIQYDYSTMWEKFVCFVDAAAIIKELGCKPEDYIKAQFHGLEWTKGIPDPIQLIGDKAKERFMKYAFEFEIKLNAPENKVKVDWKKIKKYGKDSD